MARVQSAISQSASLDDEDGDCKQCGHLFDPHIIIAFDVNDFSKGGEIRCPVEGCLCLSSLSFDFNQEGEL